MAINYKQAYQDLNRAYKALLKERMDCAMQPMLIEWLRDDRRGPANTSFTEGPERQLAYEAEAMLERLADGVYIPRAPVELKDKTQCPQCGFIQYCIKDADSA